MPSPLLILISGPPASGKTTLGRRFAEDLRLPFIHKDGIKETLFDALGVGDREWSKQLGGASYDLLFYFIEVQLRAARSLIVESNFYPPHAERLWALQQQHPFRPFQIECQTEGSVLFERFQARAHDSARHPGHVDHLNFDEFRERLLRGKSEPLNIGGLHLTVDTTNFDAIPYDTLLAALRSQSGT